MKNALPGNVPVLCPRCGESLSAPAGYERVVCPRCGITFSVEAGRQLMETREPRRAQARAQPPRRKKHPFRWLLVCAAVFLLGRMLLTGAVRQARNERRTEASRTLSVPAVTVSPRPTAAPKPKLTAKPASTPEPAATPGSASAPRTEGVSPEFKRYMDSYEAFFDEYLEFMERMDEEDGGFDILLRYADMLARYAEVMESLDAIGEEELSTADELYYLEVLGRINRKLLGASGG